MPKRVVMLEFRAAVTWQEIEKFHRALLELAARVPYKVWMHCGPHVPLAGEAALDKRAPDLTSPSFMAVWEFPDRDALEAFVDDPLHHAFASGVARNIVQRRYVVNIL